jgi:Protein of unknown function (DUF3551)
MRAGLIGVLGIAAIWAADLQTASAQESFFNARYCTRGGGKLGGGQLDCAYHTWQQCIASARGLGRYCTENPFWHGSRQQPATQGRSRR